MFRSVGKEQEIMNLQEGCSISYRAKLWCSAAGGCPGELTVSQRFGTEVTWPLIRAVSPH